MATQQKQASIEKEQKLLGNPKLYSPTSLQQVVSFSSTITANCSIDALRWFSRDPQPFKTITFKQKQSQKPREIILSDVRILTRNGLKQGIDEECFIINTLIEKGFSVCGLNASGARIPIPKLDPDRSAPAFYELQLQSGPASIIARQLSSQGFDLQQFYILDTATLMELTDDYELEVPDSLSLSSSESEGLFQQVMPVFMANVPLEKVNRLWMILDDMDYGIYNKLLSFFQKLRALTDLTLGRFVDEFLFSPTFWTRFKNLKKLSLEVYKLKNFHFSSSILPNLTHLVIKFYDSSTEMAGLPELIESLELEADPNNNDLNFSFRCMESTLQLSKLNKLKELDSQIPIVDLNALPKNLEVLKFHCNYLQEISKSLPLTLDFSAFPKLRELTIYYDSDKGEPIVSGLQFIPIFKMSRFTLSGHPEEETEKTEEISENSIDTDTQNREDEVLTVSYSIKERNRLGTIQDFPHKLIRQKIDTSGLTFSDESYIDGIEKLEIKLVEAKTLEEDSCLKVGQGMCRIKLSPGINWQPLPRRSIDDCIQQMSAPPGSQIRYNLQSDQYEILLPESEEDQLIQYTLAHSDRGPHKSPRSYLPKPLSKLEKDFLAGSRFSLPSFPGPVERLRFFVDKLPNYFHSFGGQALKGAAVDGKQYTWLDILKQRQGACRHRAFVYTKFCQNHGIAARIIKNEIHDFVEVYDPFKAAWLPINLGGHPSQLRYDDWVEINPRPAQAYFSQNSATAKKYSSLSQVYEHLFSQNDWRLETTGLPEARGVYADIYRHVKDQSPSLDICYVESALELKEAWVSSVIQADGSVALLPGPLQKMLSSGGLIIIAWERFTASEIAAFKSLLDTPPTLFGFPIAKLKVLSLTSPKVEACGAFYSRLTQFKWPSTIPKPPPVELSARQFTSAAPLSPTFFSSSDQPPAPRKKKRGREEDMETEVPLLTSKSDACLQIDLYGDEDWRNRLVGRFFLGEKGPDFLAGALADPKLPTGNGIVELIDPPWHDPDFSSFILRTELEKAVWIHGKRHELPANFRWRFAAPGPQKKQPKDMPKDLETRSDLPVFYLNSSTFSLLFEQCTLDADNQPLQLPGWLAQATMGGKGEKQQRQLIQTEDLPPGKMRRIADALAAHPECGVEWSKLKPKTHSQVKRAKTAETKSSSSSEGIVPDQPSSSLVITSDPYFVAEQWQSQYSLFEINPTTTANDLLELAQLLPQQAKDEAKGLALPQCSHKFQAMAEALLAGKNVLLYGQLSEEMYLALETALAPQPYLVLTKSHPHSRKLGKLVIVTEPIDFPTPLAEYKQPKQEIPPTALWAAYKQRLQKELGSQFNPEHWRRLTLFYSMAEKFPQTNQRLSYTRLRSSLQLLQRPCLDDDNPIKSLIHQPHNSEAYAYLNVLAKYLFGPERQKPGLRLKKLRKYQAAGSYSWGHLNCLNAAALRRILGADISGLTLEKPPEVDWTKLEQDCQAIHPNPSPMRKLLQRLEKGLQQHRMIVLKGPPGTGKTYTANAYAAKYFKANCFLAGDPAQIVEWLKNPEASILIADEAHLKSAGSWEFLRPLLKSLSSGSATVTYKGISYSIPATHRVIFTRNESPNGEIQALLQEVPTLNVNQWTDPDLYNYVLLPLVTRIIGRTQLKPTEKAALEILLKTYHWMQSHLPPNQISIRDLQSVALRWATDLKKVHEKRIGSDSALLLANNACKKEWQFRFIQSDQAQLLETFFEQQSIFPMEESESLVEADAFYYEEALDSSPLRLDQYSYIPTARQQKIMDVVTEDITLALNNRSHQSVDGSPLSKQGILIEGDSGFGKTELLKQTLLKQGYRMATPDELMRAQATADCPKRFIHFTASGNEVDDRRLLEMAFDKDYVVILDELNLLDPPLQEFLIQRLTGKTLEGKKISPRGFLLASQNSGASSGRKTVPAALVNRLHTFYAHEHSEQELLDHVRKLFAKDLPDTGLRGIVQGYLLERKANPEEVKDRRFFQKLAELQQKLFELKEEDPGKNLKDRNKQIMAWFESFSECTTKLDEKKQSSPPKSALGVASSTSSFFPSAAAGSLVYPSSEPSFAWGSQPA